MTEKWLLCGGAGFIGTAVCKEATKQGIECYIYDTKLDPELLYTWDGEKFVHKAIIYSQMDGIRTPLEQCIKEHADVVMSFIAIPRIAYCETHKQEAFETNVLKNVELINLCLKYEVPFVFASSMEVLSNGNSYYKFLKQLVEDQIRRVMPKWYIIRYSHVYGEKDPHSSRVITRFLRGEFVVYNNPQKQFYFTYLPDVAKRTVKFLTDARYYGVKGVKRGAWSGSYTVNVISPKAYSLHTIITEIFKQPKYEIEYLPEQVRYESTRVLNSTDEKWQHYRQHTPAHLGYNIADDIRDIKDVIKDGKILPEDDA